MDTLRLDSISAFVVAYGLPLLWKVAEAIVLWIVGSLVIRALLGAVNRGLLAKGLDTTLTAYAGSVLGVLFRLFLVLAILGVFGVETTSFAAVLAAAGVAIGMAWSGLLANFAAGVFLMVLRPFKAGDMISGAGLTGMVKEIGLEFNPADTVLAVRPSCHNHHYWDVYFATNEAIAAACSEAGYPVPAQAMRHI